MGKIKVDDQTRISPPPKKVFVAELWLFQYKITLKLFVSQIIFEDKNKGISIRHRVNFEAIKNNVMAALSSGQPELQPQPQLLLGLSQTIELPL